MTMYIAFVRPQLGYGDIIYDEAYNEKFHQKLESIQYNACLALLELLEDSQEKNFTILYVLNPSKVDIGAGNFPYFIRFSKKIN